MLLLALACSSKPVVALPEPAPARLTRDQFNLSAQRRHVPVFWLHDTDGSHSPDPSEVVALWNHQPPQTFDAATLTALIKAWTAPPVPPVPPVPREEAMRQEALVRELDQGRPSVIVTQVEPDETAFVDAMAEVARAIETLHALQRSDATIAADPLSQAVAFRNQAPWCVQAATKSDPDCHATLQASPPVYGIYDAHPPDCSAMESAGLMTPFTAVRRGVAVPYSEAWPEAMVAAQQAIEHAADRLGPEEAAQQAYLQRRRPRLIASSRPQPALSPSSSSRIGQPVHHLPTTPRAQPGATTPLST